MNTTEQLNIEGRRSGNGFVAHKDILANALSRASAERVTLFDNDVTVGRKGLTTYLKALTGNIVKVAPVNGSAGGSQAVEKGIRVAAGSHQSYITDGAWIRDKTPVTFCQVRVLPCNIVVPNLGSIELAEALSRVLPFTARDESRPVLNCVRMEIKEGKLTLVSADGFRMGIASLNLAEGDGEALIHRDDLKTLIPALRKSRRVRLAIEQKADSRYAIIDTEVVSYKLLSQEGSYPDYLKLIPQDFTAQASFDTKEAIKACRNLLTLWFNDNLKPLYHPLILTVGDGRMSIEAKEEKGKAEIEAETQGEGKIAVNGQYLLETLKACGGIVNLQVSSPASAMLFSIDGYQVVLMPVALNEVVSEAEKVVKEAGARPKQKGKGKARETVAQAKPDETSQETTEPETVGVA